MLQRQGTNAALAALLQQMFFQMLFAPWMPAALPKASGCFVYHRRARHATDDVEPLLAADFRTALLVRRLTPGRIPFRSAVGTWAMKLRHRIPCRDGTPRGGREIEILAYSTTVRRQNAACKLSARHGSDMIIDATNDSHAAAPSFQATN